MSDEAPALVGTSEAADILGVATSQVSRWAKPDKRTGKTRMPPPAADLAATPVWHHKHVAKLAEDPRAEFEPEPLDLVSTREAAELLRVDRSQIGRWRRSASSAFPEPCAELRAGPLWWTADVRAFSPPRGRRAAA